MTRDEFQIMLRAEILEEKKEIENHAFQYGVTPSRTITPRIQHFAGETREAAALAVLEYVDTVYNVYPFMNVFHEDDLSNQEHMQIFWRVLADNPRLRIPGMLCFSNLNTVDQPATLKGM